MFYVLVIAFGSREIYIYVPRVVAALELRHSISTVNFSRAYTY